MKYNIPPILIFPDSRLKIYYETKIQVNQTYSAIVIVGTRNGFLSLANSLLYLGAELEDDIDISQFYFIHSDCKLIIKDSFSPWDFYLGESIRDMPVKKDENKLSFVWEMGEYQYNSICTSIHSLGNSNPEIHFDSGLDKNDISVYCVVE